MRPGGGVQHFCTCTRNAAISSGKKLAGVLAGGVKPRNGSIELTTSGQKSCGAMLGGSVAGCSGRGGASVCRVLDVCCAGGGGSPDGSARRASATSSGDTSS